MQTPLDQAITDTAAAEATYSTDIDNVNSIKTAIDTATAPLSAATSKLNTDAGNYREALTNLAQVATETAKALPTT